MCQFELLFKYGNINAMKLLSFLFPLLIMSFIKNNDFDASCLIIFLLSASFFTI